MIVNRRRETKNMMKLILDRGLKSKKYSWISVKDLCRGIVIAAACDWKKFSQHSYFITHPKTITDIELIESTAQVLKKRGFIFPLPHCFLQLVSMIADRIPALHQPLQSLGPDRIKEILPACWVANGSSFQSDTKWQAEQTLLEALEETKEWLETQKGYRL